MEGQLFLLGLSVVKTVFNVSVGTILVHIQNVASVQVLDSLYAQYDLFHVPILVLSLIEFV